MPRGDSTGPEGKGPKTGRGLGKCSGNSEPGYKSISAKRGFAGNGRGQGRGLGRNIDAKA